MYVQNISKYLRKIVSKLKVFLTLTNLLLSNYKKCRTRTRRKIQETTTSEERIHFIRWLREPSKSPTISLTLLSSPLSVPDGQDMTDWDWLARGTSKFRNTCLTLSFLSKIFKFKSFRKVYDSEKYCSRSFQLNSR